MCSICSFLRAPPAASASPLFSFQAFSGAWAALGFSLWGSADLPSAADPALPPVPRQYPQPCIASVFFFFLLQMQFSKGLLTKLHTFVWAWNLASWARSRPSHCLVVLCEISLLSVRPFSRLRNAALGSLGCRLFVMFALQGQRLLKKHPLLL